MWPWILAASTSAAAAAIPVGESVSATDLEAPHRLRSGLVLGLTLGAGLGSASGYPNDTTLIGDPRFYSASGAMLGTSEDVFVMGALTDYVSVGFWYGHAISSNGEWKSTGDGGGVRVDVFPFIGVSRYLTGLGVLARFGLASGSLSRKATATTVSEGTQSFGAAGAFYEWAFGRLLGGHFGVGPGLEYDAIWSQAFERHGLIATARVAFYGGP
ncbi:MAG: hypothetical protein M3O50_05390 [Myxococcota bacterium]|nr:hypothetical protein [Myxococcota bacterium]